mmetsp:Transcript_11381/g.31064  ORF Transcript_11381/g.31064 Transcript_11381/m.31064 type:complete len:276 (-) Transcript_11381:130-957(-)
MAQHSFQRGEDNVYRGQQLFLDAPLAVYSVEALHVLQRAELVVLLVPILVVRGHLQCRRVVAILRRRIHPPVPHGQDQHAEVAAEHLHRPERLLVELDLELRPVAGHQLHLRVRLMREALGLFQEALRFLGGLLKLTEVAIEEGFKGVVEALLEPANLLYSTVTREFVLEVVKYPVDRGLHDDRHDNLSDVFVVGGVVAHGLLSHRRSEHRAAKASHQAADGGPLLGSVVHVVGQPREAEYGDGGRNELACRVRLYDVEAAEDDNRQDLAQRHAE